MFNYIFSTNIAAAELKIKYEPQVWQQLSDKLDKYFQKLKIQDQLWQQELLMFGLPSTQIKGLLYYINEAFKQIKAYVNNFYQQVNSRHNRTGIRIKDDKILNDEGILIVTLLINEIAINFSKYLWDAKYNNIPTIIKNITKQIMQILVVRGIHIHYEAENQASDSNNVSVKGTLNELKNYLNSINCNNIVNIAQYNNKIQECIIKIEQKNNSVLGQNTPRPKVLWTPQNQQYFLGTNEDFSILLNIYAECQKVNTQIDIMLASNYINTLTDLYDTSDSHSVIKTINTTITEPANGNIHQTYQQLPIKNIHITKKMSTKKKILILISIIVILFSMILLY
jgi:hypothetical protein